MYSLRQSVQVFCPFLTVIFFLLLSREFFYLFWIQVLCWICHTQIFYPSLCLVFLFSEQNIDKYSLAHVWTLYKWNLTVYIFLSIASFTQHHVCEIHHVVICNNSLLHSLNLPKFVYPFYFSFAFRLFFIKAIIIMFPWIHLYRCFDEHRYTSWGVYWGRISVWYIMQNFNLNKY